MHTPPAFSPRRRSHAPFGSDRVRWAMLSDIDAGGHLRAVCAAAGGVCARGLQRHRLRLWPDGLGQDIHHGQAPHDISTAGRYPESTRGALGQHGQAAWSGSMVRQHGQAAWAGSPPARGAAPAPYPQCRAMPPDPAAWCKMWCKGKGGCRLTGGVCARAAPLPSPLPTRPAADQSGGGGGPMPVTRPAAHDTAARTG
jgi:hypothetical protein